MTLSPTEAARLRNKLLIDLDNLHVENLRLPRAARLASIDVEERFIKPIFGSPDQLRFWAASWNIELTTYQIRGPKSTTTTWTAFSKPPLPLPLSIPDDSAL